MSVPPSAVTVCIPWRTQPERVDAYRRVTDYWKHFGFTVITADSDSDWTTPFNRSRARNKAVKQADTDVIIVADADTLPDIASVYAALQNPRIGVTWPFDTYRHIPASWTTKSDLMAAPIDKVYTNSHAALFVCTTETYWSVGGFDERFVGGWGFEDNAFRSAVNTLSKVNRTPGIAFSFNHPEKRDMTPANPNWARHELYRFAEKRPDVMKALIGL